MTVTKAHEYNKLTMIFIYNDHVYTYGNYIDIISLSRYRKLYQCIDNSSSMCACMMYVQLQTFNRDSTVNAWTSLVV